MKVKGINWKVMDALLLGVSNTDDVPDETKDEIHRFLAIHDMDIFSEESLKMLSGIWNLSLKKAYEATTQSRVPNIFERIALEKEEEEE